MNTRQVKDVAKEAFLAGVANGGDSSPIDGDHEAIQQFVQIAFESWWKRWLEQKARP